MRLTEWQHRWEGLEKGELLHVPRLWRLSLTSRGRHGDFEAARHKGSKASQKGRPPTTGSDEALSSFRKWYTKHVFLDFKMYSALFYSTIRIVDEGESFTVLARPALGRFLAVLCVTLQDLTLNDWSSENLPIFGLAYPHLAHLGQ